MAIGPRGRWTIGLDRRGPACYTLRVETDAPALRAARFSDRFAAYLIDAAPFGAGSVLSVWIVLFPLGKPPTPQVLALIGAAWVTAMFGYQLLGNMAGGTPGKKLLGLRLVARDGGGEPGFVRSLVRTVVWFLGTPAGSFGFLVALLNKENRTLHDFASGTVVVEATPKSAGSGAVAFVLAAGAAIALFGLQIGIGWLKPTPADSAAIAKAKDGLSVIALVQEAYKDKNGQYASSIDQLASASGDPEQFKAAMAGLFMPEPIEMEAGNRGWRIRALARDRRRTPVVKSGP